MINKLQHKKNFKKIIFKRKAAWTENKIFPKIALVNCIAHFINRLRSQKVLGDRYDFVLGSFFENFVIASKEKLCHTLTILLQNKHIFHCPGSKYCKTITSITSADSWQKLWKSIKPAMKKKFLKNLSFGVDVKL